MIRFLIVFILFLITSCSTYTIASLSTNVVTVASTGKTNTDHVVSFFTGKDCSVFRVVKNQEICSQNNTVLALNKEKNNFDNTKNNKIIGKTINMAYHITKNVVKDHVMGGARITDTMKLTNELEKKIESIFDGSSQSEKQIKVTKENLKEENLKKVNIKEVNIKEVNIKEENLKEENIKEENLKEENIYKKDFWRERVEQEQKKRESTKQKFLTVITVEEGAVGGFASHVSKFLSDETLLDGGLKFRSFFNKIKLLNKDIIYVSNNHE